MNIDDEIAVAVLVRMKRCMAAPVIVGGSPYTEQRKRDDSLSQRSKNACGKRSSISASVGVSKSQPLRKKTVSKMKPTRSKNSKRTSNPRQFGQLSSPVAVTSTHHHLLEIQKASSLLLPNFSQGKTFNANLGPIEFDHQKLNDPPNPIPLLSQVNHHFCPQISSNDEANSVHVFGGNLFQEQLMALAKQVCPQDMATALLSAEIESLKSQITAQHAQSRNSFASLPNLVSNMQGYAPYLTKVEGLDHNSKTFALIASWILQTCPSISSQCIHEPQG